MVEQILSVGVAKMARATWLNDPFKSMGDGLQQIGRVGLGGKASSMPVDQNNAVHRRWLIAASGNVFVAQAAYDEAVKNSRRRSLRAWNWMASPRKEARRCRASRSLVQEIFDLV
jgi:hypothetical protein